MKRLWGIDIIVHTYFKNKINFFYFYLFSRVTDFLLLSADWGRLAHWFVNLPGGEGHCGKTGIWERLGGAGGGWVNN